MSQNDSAHLFQPSAEFIAQATISGMDAYQALCAEAAQDYTGYWARLAREHVSWKKPFTQVLEGASPNGFTRAGLLGRSGTVELPFYRYDGGL